MTRPRERASAVILRDGQILMVQIEDQGVSWWCLPGGTIEAGETPEQAVVRELREELNVEAVPCRRLYTVPLPDEAGTDYGILVDLHTDTPTLGSDPMVADWAWRPLHQVDGSWQVDQVRKVLGTVAAHTGEPPSGGPMGHAHIQIVDLRPDDEKMVNEVATLLMDAFREHSPDYVPDIALALEEVRESLSPDCISRVAVDEDGAVLGYIAGHPHYYGHAWELHPLAVRPEYQRQGIGRALVTDLEERVRARGVLTLWLGTDDEDDRTTLSAVDLYPDPLEHLARIRNLRGHPYAFYQKMGFVIVGVIPDANGWGKPDIFMAKRVGSGSE
ncbi:MAG: GNAT family N-acetyltransferase [Anaerolineae bacterium]|jgi:aminoglycoside 6'-N-acetyltransferase I